MAKLPWYIKVVRTEKVDKGLKHTIKLHPAFVVWQVFISLAKTSFIKIKGIWH